MAAPAPLRVLHLTAGNLYGGVERIVAECAESRALCPAIAPSFGVCFDGRLARELDAADARCTRLGDVRVSRPWTIGAARRRLARLIETDRPHAVICHSSWMFAIAAPVIRTGSSTLALWLHDRVSRRPWAERWASMTVPDLVISNSRFTAETVPSLYAAVPRAVLYAPVSEGRALPVDERRTLRASLGVNDATPVVLIASRFEAWKGHQDLLAAVARIPEPWRVWIAGRPQRAGEESYERGLRARAAALGIADRVSFLGERTDMPALMRAADIHCQPNSGAEPFGLVFVEALYAGLPVVTTAMGGAIEIVTDACGILVPARDERALEHALRRLVSDPEQRHALGSAGPARARTLCDPAQQLARLAALLVGSPSALPVSA